MEKLIKKYTKNNHFKEREQEERRKRDRLDEYYLWWSHVKAGHD